MKADEVVKTNKALKEEDEALIIPVNNQKQETNSKALKIA